MTPYRDTQGRFLPGNPFSQGRRNGARNRVGTALLEALAEDFEQHGPSVVERVREERPVDYLKICLAVLPKDMTLTVNPMAELSDEDLYARLHDLDQALTHYSGGAGGPEGGTAAAGEDGAPHHVYALPAPE